MFDFTDKTLNQVPFTIAPVVIITRLFGVFLGRDDRLGSAGIGNFLSVGCIDFLEFAGCWIAFQPWIGGLMYTNHLDNLLVAQGIIAWMVTSSNLPVVRTESYRDKILYESFTYPFICDDSERTVYRTVEN